MSFRCPYCGSETQPDVKSKISTEGLIVLVVLLVVCMPLFWIGLLLKEDYRICSDCGIKLGG